MQLEAIVELWRETLAPEAELAAHTAAAALPDATWPKQLHAEWLKRAVQPSETDIVELMRVTDFAVDSARHLIERLELVATWQPHPIVTRWLVDVLARQTRAPLLAGQKCFRRVFNLLIDSIDHAGAARFEAWLGTHVERIAASEFGAKFFDDGIRRVLAKSERRRAAARALTPAELAHLARAGLLVAPQPSKPAVTLEALYAAVYEAPWDDAPRSVLADFLQQQGDPRGELIAMGLAAHAPTADREALIAKHAKAWFPKGLARVVRRDATYERGRVQDRRAIRRGGGWRELGGLARRTWGPDRDGREDRRRAASLRARRRGPRRHTVAPPLSARSHGRARDRARSTCRSQGSHGGPGERFSRG